MFPLSILNSPTVLTGYLAVILMAIASGLTLGGLTSDSLICAEVSLSRKVRWRSPSGKTLDLNFERFVSLADEHVLSALSVNALDFDGSIQIQASINGYPENQGFNHWELLDQGDTPFSSRQERGMCTSVHPELRIELGMASVLKLSG